MGGSGRGRGGRAGSTRCNTIEPHPAGWTRTGERPVARSVGIRQKKAKDRLYCYQANQASASPGSHRHCTSTLRAGDSIRLRYQCSPYHTSSALQPIITQLEWAAHIEIDETPETKLDKLESLLAQSTQDVNIGSAADSITVVHSHRRPLCTHYASPGTAEGKKHWMALVVQLKDCASAGQYCLSSRTLTGRIQPRWSCSAAIIEEVQDNRVLGVNHFPPGVPIVPWAGYTHITALTLNRFSRGRVAALIDKVTSAKPLPDEVRDQIIDKTDGVPLFVEELTKTVLESGLVEDRGDHYALAGPLSPLAIPSTIQDSLMARLDRLGEVKETAQIAAVIGREFNYSLVAGVSTLPEAELDAALAQLTDAALVFSKGTLPRSRFVFKHAMVQEAAYESLLKSKTAGSCTPGSQMCWKASR